MRATVCLPTYDERANLEPMLRALAGVLRAGDRVLVIDDNSPDGTGELADRLAEELAFVSVLHRPHKEGLGPAYLAGFRQALDDGAELVLEMDCDFSHDPADVPRLIAAAESAWIETLPRSNGMRERPFAMSSASATRIRPASIVSGWPSERWLMIACSTSAVSTVTSGST